MNYNLDGGSGLHGMCIAVGQEYLFLLSFSLVNSYLNGAQVCMVFVLPLNRSVCFFLPFSLVNYHLDGGSGLRGMCIAAEASKVKMDQVWGHSLTLSHFLGS